MATYLVPCKCSNCGAEGLFWVEEGMTVQQYLAKKVEVCAHCKSKLNQRAWEEILDGIIEEIQSS